MIGGATDDGKISEKADVLSMVIKRLGLSGAEECILIGDTRFDALGAKAVHMDCIGVTYGFGSRKELEDAGVVSVFDTLKEVEAYFEE